MAHRALVPMDTHRSARFNAALADSCALLRMPTVSQEHTATVSRKKARDLPREVPALPAVHKHQRIQTDSMSTKRKRTHARDATAACTARDTAEFGAMAMLPVKHVKHACAKSMNR